MKSLELQIEAVVYPREPDPEEPTKGGWMILATSQGIAKGNVAWRPAKGERLILFGDYESYKGTIQFSFTEAKAYLPVDPRAELAYAAELTSGVGPGMEERIWDQWGDQWRDTVEPGVIKGLNDKVYDRLLRSLDDMSIRAEQTEAITWLMSIGATQKLAESAWDKWRRQTAGVVKSDCYRLVELRNYGFAAVDRGIRHKLGIEDDDPRRITAGVMCTMRDQTKWGSTVISCP